ncbi:unnamed protein product [Vitrella brassicaformis CCMP3155]|uniref:Uncharacterized protein n=1 Tax=Vitrella brassicaformis (strain CCMP3155) TaxID=1169540 RepID=A0A0G4ECS4_VITBC|nr:unnamed protein product [Vitrella brassicaformis CCMP3155]|eukprot:CEL93776.1 unnamed protein product [Vitrella brassicaformis CCMP3155]
MMVTQRFGLMGLILVVWLAAVQPLMAAKRTDDRGGEVWTAQRDVEGTKGLANNTGEAAIEAINRIEHIIGNTPRSKIEERATARGNKCYVKADSTPTAIKYQEGKLAPHPIYKGDFITRWSGPITTGKFPEEGVKKCSPSDLYDCCVYEVDKFKPWVFGSLHILTKSGHSKFGYEVTDANNVIFGKRGWDISGKYCEVDLEGKKFKVWYKCNHGTAGPAKQTHWSVV